MVAFEKWFIHTFKEWNNDEELFYWLRVKPQNCGLELNCWLHELSNESDTQAYPRKMTKQM